MSRRKSISATLFRPIARKELQGVHVPPATNGVVIIKAQTVETEMNRPVAVAK